MNCEVCHKVIEIRSGRVPSFCSGACRQKAYRQRRRRAKQFDRLAEGRWVRADGKRPITAAGSPASSTDPSTWSTRTSIETSTAGDGIGVMLGGGLGCYDFDNCFSAGELTPAAREALASIPEPALRVERSVSGRGLHVFVEAPEARGSRRAGVERYTAGRFIRLGEPVTDQSILELLRR